MARRLIRVCSWAVSLLSAASGANVAGEWRRGAPHDELGVAQGGQRHGGRRLRRRGGDGGLLGEELLEQIEQQLETEARLLRRRNDRPPTSSQRGLQLNVGRHGGPAVDVSSAEVVVHKRHGHGRNLHSVRFKRKSRRTIK